MTITDYAPFALSGLQFLGMTGAAIYRAIHQDATSRENRHVVPVAIGCAIAASGLLASPILSVPTIGWLLAAGMGFVTLPTLFDIRHIARTSDVPAPKAEDVHSDCEQKQIVFVDRSPAILRLQRMSNMVLTPTQGADHVRDDGRNPEHATA